MTEELDLKHHTSGNNFPLALSDRRDSETDEGTIYLLLLKDHRMHEN